MASAASVTIQMRLHDQPKGSTNWRSSSGMRWDPILPFPWVHQLSPFIFWLFHTGCNLICTSQSNQLASNMDCEVICKAGVAWGTTQVRTFEQPAHYADPASGSQQSAPCHPKRTYQGNLNRLRYMVQTLWSKIGCSIVNVEILAHILPFSVVEIARWLLTLSLVLNFMTQAFKVEFQ